MITDAPAKDASLLSNGTEIVRHIRVKVNFMLASESVSVHKYSQYYSGGIVLSSTFEIDKVIQTLASKRTGNTPIINASLLRNKKLLRVSLFISQVCYK